MGAWKAPLPRAALRLAAFNSEMHPCRAAPARLLSGTLITELQSNPLGYFTSETLRRLGWRLMELGHAASAVRRPRRGAIRGPKRLQT